MRERGGDVVRMHVQDTTQDTLHGAIKANVEKGSDVYTDTGCGYKGLGTEYAHSTVNHNIGQYRKGETCTNGMENYWSILKRAYKGTYTHVEPQHLHRYLAEEEFRFNSRKSKDGERFDQAVRQVAGKRLTYAELVENHLITLER